MIINELKYPWLAVAATSGVSHQQYPPPTNTTTTAVQEEFPPPSRLQGWSLEGKEIINTAHDQLIEHGAVAYPNFLTEDAVARAVAEMRSKEDNAFTTNTKHTAYLKHLDTTRYATNPIYNHPTKTIVASTAYDELAEDSVLKELYEDPRLLNMVASIVLGYNSKELYLSEDPLGCCSVNVFRPGYYHGFHYDESEFSVTLMLQEAEGGGLFQYTDPIREKNLHDNESEDLTLELKRTADVFRDHEHDPGASSEKNTTTSTKTFAEHEEAALEDNDVVTPDSQDEKEDTAAAAPCLHTLDFSPGTLLVLAGSKSLHRVTAIQGNKSRFVAVLTFASKPGFCNTPEVQEMFWGRTATVEPRIETECEASI